MEQKQDTASRAKAGRIGARANGELYCLACADAYLRRPACTLCDAVPKRGFASLGRAHRACGIASRFVSRDGNCCPVEPVFKSRKIVVCAFCADVLGE